MSFRIRLPDGTHFLRFKTVRTDRDGPLLRRVVADAVGATYATRARAWRIMQYGRLPAGATIVPIDETAEAAARAMRTAALGSLHRMIGSKGVTEEAAAAVEALLKRLSPAKLAAMVAA